MRNFENHLIKIIAFTLLEKKILQTETDMVCKHQTNWNQDNSLNATQTRMFFSDMDCSLKTVNNLT